MCLCLFVYCATCTASLNTCLMYCHVKYPCAMYLMYCHVKYPCAMYLMYCHVKYPCALYLVYCHVKYPCALYLVYCRGCHVLDTDVSGYCCHLPPVWLFVRTLCVTVGAWLHVYE